MKKATQHARRVRRARNQKGLRKSGRLGMVFTIHDPRGLGHEIREIIREVHGGSVNATARSVGISASQLGRYAQGTATRIRLATLVRLKRLFPEGEAPWHHYVFGETTMDALTDYAFWLHTLTESIVAPKSLVIAASVWGARDWNGAELELEKLIRRARAVVPEVFTDLAALISTSQYAQDRHRLAILRTFEPLLAYPFAGGIERHPDELSDAEFSAFVRAGFTREKILLQREGDGARAQAAVRRHLPTVSTLSISDRLARLVEQMSVNSAAPKKASQVRASS